MEGGLRRSLGSDDRFASFGQGCLEGDMSGEVIGGTTRALAALGIALLVPVLGVACCVAIVE